MRTFVSIANGATVSSACFLERGALGFTVMVPSISASAVYVQYAQTSGGSPWFDLARTDGSGALHAVYSGPGPGCGFVEKPPTPYLRFRLGQATGEASSFAVIPRW